MHTQPLEPRWLMANFQFELINGFITYIGSDDGERVFIESADGGRIKAYSLPISPNFDILAVDNTRYFNRSDVNGFRIDTAGGNDRVDISPKINLPASIATGDGSDTVFSGSGLDSIVGGDDLDYIHGGKGSDKIFGESGDDRLFGDAGFDSLYGGDGDDRLDGGSSRDLVAGGKGNDTLDGGIGRVQYGLGDVLDGNAGRDSIKLRYANSEYRNIDRFLVGAGGTSSDNSLGEQFYTSTVSPLTLDVIELRAYLGNELDANVFVSLVQQNDRGYVSTWSYSVIPPQTPGAPTQIVVIHDSVDVYAPTDRNDKQFKSFDLGPLANGNYVVRIISNGQQVAMQAFNVSDASRIPLARFDPIELPVVFE